MWDPKSNRRRPHAFWAVNWPVPLSTEHPLSREEVAAGLVNGYARITPSPAFRPHL